MSGMTGTKLREWLLEDWRQSGARIGLIEGVSGIGKTMIAREVARVWSAHSLVAEISPRGDKLEDLLFEIAAGLEIAGCKTVANAHNSDFRAGLKTHLAEDHLLVLDEFQYLLEPGQEQSLDEVLLFLQEVNQAPGQGKILLVSSRRADLVERLPDIQSAKMGSFSPAEARNFLRLHLERKGLEETVPHGLTDELVLWLGCNARAMKAFVACLHDFDLNDLIEEESETWELRHNRATEDMVRHLQTIFVDKTISKLTTDARILLEIASVLRKPFKSEMLRKIAEHYTNFEVAKRTLDDLFLIERTAGKYLDVNPIARHITYSTLKLNHRKRIKYHGAIARHFVKLATHGGNYRQIVASANAFVEARYHLREAQDSLALEHLAGDFRRIIAPNYAKMVNIPESSQDLNEYILVLQAVLAPESGGFFEIREKFARALIRRAGDGDEILALKNLHVATRGLRDPGAWNSRVQLAARHESTLARKLIVDEARERLSEAGSTDVAFRTAELLVADGLIKEAAEVAITALRAVEQEDNLQRLTTLLSFVRVRGGHPHEAMKVLRDGYLRLRYVPEKAYKLYEESIFIAQQQTDMQALRTSREMIAKYGLNSHQPVLTDILLYALRGDWQSIVDLGSGHVQYPAIRYQVMFAYLCRRQPEMAAQLLFESNVKLRDTSVKHWFTLLISWSIQDSSKCEMSVECLQQFLKKNSEEDIVTYWFRVWDTIPRRVKMYPAFYFPVLPAALTGFSFDLRHHDWRETALGFVNLRETAPPRSAVYGRYNAEATATAGKGALSNVIVNTTNWMEAPKLGDNYNVYSNIGPIGPKSRMSVKSSHVENLGASAGAGYDLSDDAVRQTLMSELERIRGAIPSDRNTGEAGLNLVTSMETAVMDQDANRFEQFVKMGGRWLADHAGQVGATMVATILSESFGIS